MAGDWLKVTHALPMKPEVWAIAQELGLDPDAVVGKLLRVWVYFDTQTEDGYAPSISKAIIDRDVGVPGFIDAMIKVRWLKDDTSMIHVVNFDYHISKTAKSRALSRNRMQANRQKTAEKTRTSEKPLRSERNSGDAASVTIASLEKRREKNISQDQEIRPKKTHAYTDDFERMWAKRPPRAGSDSKAKAFKALSARLKQGASLNEIEAGLDRYILFVQADGTAGTRNVLMLATFFGPDEHYLTLYNIPENNNAKGLNERNAESARRLADRLANDPDYIPF